MNSIDAKFAALLTGVGITPINAIIRPNGCLIRVATETDAGVVEVALRSIGLADVRRSLSLGSWVVRASHV